MLHLVINNDEPRILDTDLAEALGMKTPRNIRKDLIVPNLTELRGYGDLGASPPKEKRRGRPVLLYHLNEDQALLLCMFSRTPKAVEVRKLVITTFRAYQKGHLTLSDTGKVALPDFANPADAARAWAEMWESGVKDRKTVAAHLEQLTINEFFALNHLYGSPPEKSRLSARARKLCVDRSIPILKQARTTVGGYEVQVNVYPLKELLEAAAHLGIDSTVLAPALAA